MHVLDGLVRRPVNPQTQTGTRWAWSTSLVEVNCMGKTHPLYLGQITFGDNQNRIYLVSLLYHKVAAAGLYGAMQHHDANCSPQRGQERLFMPRDSLGTKV